MKKLVMLLVAALLMNVVSVSAKELKPKKTYASTTLEITDLLSPSSNVGILEEDVMVRVKVMLSADQEIVVIGTNTSNEELSSYIKEKLNLKKLSSNELEQGVTYEFEVNFKA